MRDARERGGKYHGQKTLRRVAAFDSEELIYTSCYKHVNTKLAFRTSVSPHGSKIWHSTHHPVIFSCHYSETDSARSMHAWPQSQLSFSSVSLFLCCTWWKKKSQRYKEWTSGRVPRHKLPMSRTHRLWCYWWLLFSLTGLLIKILLLN